MGTGLKLETFFLHQSLWILPIHDHLKLNFPLEFFSEYVGKRNLNPHEAQPVVSNSQGIILILLLTVGLRQSVSLLFPSARQGCTVGKVLWTPSIL